MKLSCTSHTIGTRGAGPLGGFSGIVLSENRIGGNRYEKRLSGRNQ
jgi:hypothetical protein